MRRCCTCVYQGVKPYNKPCSLCECNSDSPDGTWYVENTEDNKDMIKDPSTQVHANPDFGVGNTHVVDDGTAAASPHYNSLPVQPLELMEAVLTREEFFGYLKGNMIKYAMRAGKKGAVQKDVAKYKQYKSFFDDLYYDPNTTISDLLR